MTEVARHRACLRCARESTHASRRVRSKDEIRPEWFEGVEKAAIIGGILVPQWSLDEAAGHVRAFSPDPRPLLKGCARLLAAAATFGRDESGQTTDRCMNVIAA